MISAIISWLEGVFGEDSIAVIIATVLFVIVTVGILLAMSYIAIRAIYIYLTGITVLARIVDKRGNIEKIFSFPFEKYTVKYPYELHIKYEYSDRTGKKFAEEDEVDIDLFRKHKIGDYVEIKYHKKDPSKSTFVSAVKSKAREGLFSLIILSLVFYFGVSAIIEELSNY